MTSLRRISALGVLLVGLSTGVVFAQSGNPNEMDIPAEPTQAEPGNPLYGYIGTAFLGALAMFVLCKSARR